MLPDEGRNLASLAGFRGHPRTGVPLLVDRHGSSGFPLLSADVTLAGGNTCIAPHLASSNVTPPPRRDAGMPGIGGKGEVQAPHPLGLH